MKRRLWYGAAVLIILFVLFSAGLALCSSCEGKESGIDSALGVWYTTIVWDSTDIETTFILGEKEIQMLSYDLESSAFVWGVNGSYEESGNTLTVTVKDGYLEQSWMDSNSAYWNEFLATLDEFWGAQPYTMTYSVSGNDLTLTMNGETITYTQVSASLNHIGA